MRRNRIINCVYSAPESVPIAKAFGIFGFKMNDEVKLHTLKNRYKKLVLKHHPDHGGVPENFLLVQKSYKLLRKYGVSTSSRKFEFERIGPHEAGVWNIKEQQAKSLDYLDICLVIIGCLSVCQFFSARQRNFFAQRKAQNERIESDTCEKIPWHAWKSFTGNTL